MTKRQAVLPSTIELLRTHSLASAAQDEIERLILSGEYAPGEKLGEAEVAARLGISRGPVREAFRGLDQAGMVRFERNRGVFVREIALEEAADNYVVRGVLEELAGRLIAPTITDEEIRGLRAITNRMEAAIERNDHAASAGLNFEFHLRLLDLTRNPKLIAVYRNITKELIIFRSKAHFPQESLDEHRGIIDKLAARDPAAASKAMLRHVEAGWHRMRPALDPAESIPRHQRLAGLILR